MAPKFKVGLVTLIVIAAGMMLVTEHQTRARLEKDNQALRRQLAQAQVEIADFSKIGQTKHTREPRLPPPAFRRAVSASAPMEDVQSGSLYARFANNPPKLTAEQVQAYLKANGRKASSLLAAYRTSGDQALLKEAMEKFPNDPQVAFEAIFKGDLSAEQRRQWLETFKRTAPENALPNYLSALDYFKAGQAEQALQELMAVSGKNQFQDYTLERMQDNQEAYLAGGYSVAESKLIGAGELLLPQLDGLKKLGLQMVDLANSYRQSGDQASAQAVLQMAINLGQSYGRDTEPTIGYLVGLAIQRNALSAMDPNSPVDTSGQTVQDRLNEIAQQKTAIVSLFKQNESLLQSMSDQDWINYIDRQKIFGEEAALRWYINKRGEK